MNIAKAKSVEDYLNNVSYDHTGYVPKDASLSFMNFIKLVNGSNNNLDKSPVTHYKLMDNVFSKKSRLAILCHRGFAKALSLDTELITPTGTTTIANISIGDSVIGEDGKPSRITHKSQVFNNKMYEITLYDGRTIKVNEDHINTVIQRRTVRYGVNKKTEYQRRNLTTKELLSYKLYSSRSKTDKNPLGRECNFWLPNNLAVEFNHQEVPIDPYTLGLVLGDGSIDKGTGYARLNAYKDNCNYVGILGIGSVLKGLGLNAHGDFKFVPKVYLYNDIETRTAILKGLMDTDGTISKSGNISFCSNSKELVDAVVFLIRSLGGIAKVSSMADKAYRVNIKANFSVFNLERKVIRQHRRSVEKVAIVSIKEIPIEPSQCIRVDNESHTFLVNEFITTHNSTIITTYLPFYIAVYGRLDNFGVVNYILAVMDSQEGGAKTMRRSLELTYENSTFLQTYIKDTRFTDAFIELENVEGHRLGIKLVGAQMSIRGTRFNNKTGSHRPELAIMDDILSDVDAKSPTVTSNIENTIHKAVDKALEPATNKIIYIGTVFNTNDPLYKVIGSGRWSPSVFPVCEKFPCTREEFRGSWEERFSYDVVDRMYKDSIALGRLSDFNGEMMNRIMSAEDRLIQDSDIVWYKRDTLLKNKGMFNFYITTDFATSEKTSADYSVITVWAYNSNGDWLLVDGVCRRQLMDKNIDDLFKFSQMYKPQQVGIEITGQQGGFIQWIKNEMLVRNCYFTLASDNNGSTEGIRPNTNKLVRFNTMVPLFKTKKIMFPEELKTEPLLVEAIEELGLVSVSAIKSRHDDVMDCISMLSSLTPWKPSTESELVKSPSNSIWELEDDDEDSSILDSYII